MKAILRARLVLLLLPLLFVAHMHASVAAPAPAPPSDVGRIVLPVRTTVLANGLRVVLQEDHVTPIVAVDIWYGVGSKDEPPGRFGFAHLFEHVMFQGSKHVPEDTYFRFLERAGASNINGTTSLDRTNYFETLPSNRLDLALWLESDRMGFLLDHVNQQTFAGQREVVKNERRQHYENAPYGLVGQYVEEALYPPSHPYHHLTIGSPADLDAATLDDIRGFFREWYVPNNATLVIAGDLQPQAALASIERYFGPIPAGAPPHHVEAPKPELGGEVRLEVACGAELARVQVAWLTPTYFAPGDSDLDLVARVLASDKSSRLYKRLVYDDQIAQDVSAYQDSRELASEFGIEATAKPGHTPEELLQAIDQELVRLVAEGISGAELERARTSFLSARVFGLEGVAARADLLETYAHYTGEPDHLGKDLARYEAATVDSLRDAARTYLPQGKRVVALVRSVPGAPLAGQLVRRVP